MDILSGEEAKGYHCSVIVASVSLALHVHVNFLGRQGYHGTVTRPQVSRISPEVSLFFRVFPVILESKGNLEVKLVFKSEGV